ncbi:hypothetical protein [Methanimicrococcus blatticola]|uniref:hypothetical protein n=1 Tax=Methanimicrococcus blatticola TaxID=91560 RepID=UPI00105E4C86|nr:hypothetical protein [Methanimicrococcus blatticola]MBZ3935780.1 hypothetical protein [Methanimicrococcus blatticola]
MSAQLRASALFYHTRSLTRTEVLLPCRLRYCCYLAVCVTAVTLPFALLLLPCRLRCCCHCPPPIPLPLCLTTAGCRA